MHIDPHLYGHLQRAGTTQRDQPAAPPWYGQASVILDPLLPAGGWQLRTADGATILNDGVLHLPAAGFSPS
jgi:hypothetical protein